MNIPAETPYNYPLDQGGDGSSSNAFRCAAANSLPSAGYVYEFTSTPGVGWQTALIVQKSTDGASTNTFPWATDKCFGHNTEYQAMLMSFGGTVANPQWAYEGDAVNPQRRRDTSLGGFAGHPSYYGHYLNWYYANNSEPHSAADPFIQGHNPLDRGPNDKGTEKDAANSRMVIMAEFLVANVGLMSSGGALTDAAQVAVAIFDPEVDVNSKNPATLNYTLANDSTPSNLRIASGFKEVNNNNFSTDINNLTNSYTPGAIDWQGLRAAPDDQSLRANTSLARGLKQAARYFLEDGSATGEVLTLSSANAIAKNSNVSTINTFSLFNEEPVYTPKGAKPLLNDRVQSCLKNHVVVITDGLSRTTLDGLNVSGFSPDNPGPILAAWGDNIVDSEQVNPASLTDFADVASALYDMDLRPDIEDFDNNISTYVFGMQPSSSDETYLRKAATDGGGLYFGVEGAFYPFRSVMEEQLAAIIADIRAQGTAISGSAAKQVFSTDSLEAGTKMYQTRFNTTGWYGSLQSYDLDDSTGAVQYPYNWEANKMLPSPSSRQIFTKGTAGAVAFKSTNLSDLTATQQNDLAEVPAGSGLTASNMIDYLRGDQRQEGVLTTNFRSRPRALLGDIIHSEPKFVGAPNMPYSEANFAGYTAFKTAQAGRTPMVYVGANDGMLHAFYASTGVEAWAYIPQAVFASGESEGLSALASQNFDTDHRYYVDGSPVIVDAFFDHDGDTVASWRTVLIGTMRAGARGLFALDITDPVPLSGGNVDFSELLLWEKSGFDLTDGINDEFAGIGYVFGDPSVVKLSDGKWGVAFGNGYNSGGDKAALYVLDVTDGSQISKVEVESNNASANGMSQAKVLDLDGDGAADRIYAGDLLGNMWAFESFTNSGSADWRSAYATGANPKALFSGGDPITTAPVLMAHPDNLNAPNIVVLFGSGKLLEVTDLNTLVDSGVYGVFDTGTGGLNRSDLLARSLSTSGTDRSLGDATTTLNPASHDGWYFDLDAAERTVTDPRLYRGVFFFSSMAPSDVECDLGGDSWLMTVDPLTGLAPDFAVIDSNQDGVRNGSDIGDIAAYLRGVTTTPAILDNRMYVPGTANKGNAKEFELGSPESGSTDRLTWEELFRN